MSKIEPSVNDQLRYAQMVQGMKKLDRERLLEVSIELAHLSLVLQPAALRWSAMEAAKNLGEKLGGPYGTSKGTQ